MDRIISFNKFVNFIYSQYKGIGVIFFSSCYLMFIMAYIVIPKTPEGDEMIRFYLGAICLVCLLTIVVAYITLRTEIKIEYKYLILGTMVSFTMMLLLPPFSGPDEFSHYQSSYDIANRILHVGKPDGYPSKIYMRSVDFEYGFPNGKNMSLYDKMFEPNTGLSNAEYKEADVMLLNTSKMHYVIQGIGIAIARILNVDTLPMIYLGRIFNTIFMLAAVFISLRILPICKEILLFIAISPVFIQAGVTYSTDCFAYAMSLMYISIILSYRNGNKITVKSAIVIFILGVIVACLRSGAYLTISGAILLLNSKSFSSVSYYRRYISIALLCNLLAGILTLHSAMAKPYFQTDVAVYSVSYLLSNLDVAIGLFFHFFTETLSITLHSIFGGGVEFARPGIVLSTIADIFEITTFVLLCCAKEPIALSRKEYAVIFLMILGTVCEFSAAALTWSPRSVFFVDCLWGRYLIVPLFLLGIIFKSPLPIEISKIGSLSSVRYMFIFASVLVYLMVIYGVVYGVFLV